MRLPYFAFCVKLPALALVAALLAACHAVGGTPEGPVPGAAGRGGEAAPGFDTSRYPGDAAMRAWATSSPYRWVGYYLPAPCHRDSSWVGTRARLEQMGWRVAMIYVGQQSWDQLPATRHDSLAAADSTAADRTAPAAAAPSCSRELLSAEQGAREGADAVAKAARDGFATGATVFLDVEPMDSISTRMRAYYQGWVRAVLQDGRFRPGFYAHQSNAVPLHADLQALYTEAGLPQTPPFWLAWPAPGFSLERRPADSGLDFATIWQGRINVAETWGGVTIPIDANVGHHD